VRDRALAPLVVRGRTFAWGARTYLMGIINVTPDSFSGDGLADDLSAVVRQARAFVDAGADIIDVGGESTRPGHVPVSDADELERVIPAIAAIRANVDVPVSVDSAKPPVASAALDAGADMLNCVWGATPGMVAVASSRGVPIVIMHNRADSNYQRDVVEEVIGSLERGAEAALRAGVPAKHIIVDPGIGFGKTGDHNVEILGRLRELADRLPYALLVGTSRKSFIGKITGEPVEKRTFGTAATVALAIAGGADVVRVHDVAEMADVVDVADAICRTGKAQGRRIEAST